jgi:hypothetical protein
MECYLATKKNEIMLLAGKLMKLEVIMLSEISQFHKISIFSLICGIKGENDLKIKARLLEKEKGGGGRETRKENICMYGSVMMKFITL